MIPALRTSLLPDGADPQSKIAMGSMSQGIKRRKKNLQVSTTRQAILNLVNEGLFTKQGEGTKGPKNQTLQLNGRHRSRRGEVDVLIQDQGAPEWRY
jgi:hypothetical protein